MIISVSRRTDIPAFYSEWFFNRLKDGYVYVKNPMNSKQIGKVSLKKEDVDCFVFWTKNARPMMKNLDKLEGYNYYFQYTISPYKKDVEPLVQNKKLIIDNFIELSKILGKERMILRYDPIFINKDYTMEYHKIAFKKLCEKLVGYTDKCVISFIDLYQRTERNSRHLKIRKPTEAEEDELVKTFYNIAKEHNITIEMCSESRRESFEKIGVKAGKCIDSDLIAKITGNYLKYGKDKNQREECGCVQSVDIGEYNTCIHGCTYCYANFNKDMAKKNYELHNKEGELLIGEVPLGAVIKERKIKPVSTKKKEKVVEETSNNRTLFFEK